MHHLRNIATRLRQAWLWWAQPDVHTCVYPSDCKHCGACQHWRATRS